MNRVRQKPAAFHVYGPVPSRRLGFSLGVDLLAFKSCTLDCIYCQLGPTNEKTLRRKSFYPQDEILAEIRTALTAGQHIDYITFSGSGEPTLSADLGSLIRKIKKMTRIPVAILINSTLLSRKEVRQALMAADLVIPSLDAATQVIFQRINRPQNSLRLERILSGLKAFRGKFKGEIWLEVMLVKDINDSPSHIRKLKAAIEEINPHKVQLNTVIRPPAESFARSLSQSELQRIKKMIGNNAEIVAEFEDKPQIPFDTDLSNSILVLIQRRPVTLSDMAASLGRHQNVLLKYIKHLLQTRRIRSVMHKGQKYYEPITDNNPSSTVKKTKRKERSQDIK